MVNAGLSSLVIVNGNGLDNDAYIRAVYGKEVLSSCRMVDSLDSIASEFDILAATSGDTSFNERKFRRIPVSPEEFWKSLLPTGRRVALVFGREDDGLHNNEVEICNYFINIPSNPRFPAYNLSHAVGIILYEMLKQMAEPPGNHDIMASEHNLTLFENEVEKLLELCKYPNFSRKNSMIMLKRLIARSNITDTEYHKLRGIIASVQRKISEEHSDSGDGDHTE